MISFLDQVKLKSWNITSVMHKTKGKTKEKKSRNFKFPKTSLWISSFLLWRKLFSTQKPNLSSTLKLIFLLMYGSCGTEKIKRSFTSFLRRSDLHSYIFLASYIALSIKHSKFETKQRDSILRRNCCLNVLYFYWKRKKSYPS